MARISSGMPENLKNNSANDGSAGRIIMLDSAGLRVQQVGKPSQLQAASVHRPPCLECFGDGARPPQESPAAAVANCLSASLVFAHGEFKEDPGPVATTAVCHIERNERNWLRVTSIDVAITLGVAPRSRGHLRPCARTVRGFLHGMPERSNRHPLDRLH
jgi:hypothetical protein